MRSQIEIVKDDITPRYDKKMEFKVLKAGGKFRFKDQISQIMVSIPFDLVFFSLVNLVFFRQ
jgi:hypothetical protein